MPGDFVLMAYSKQRVSLLRNGKQVGQPGDTKRDVQSVKPFNQIIKEKGWSIQVNYSDGKLDIKADPLKNAHSTINIRVADIKFDGNLKGLLGAKYDNNELYFYCVNFNKCHKKFNVQKVG